MYALPRFSKLLKDKRFTKTEHRTPNRTQNTEQNTQQKLGVAFSSLEPKYIAIIH